MSSIYDSEEKNFNHANYIVCEIFTLQPPVTANNKRYTEVSIFMANTRRRDYTVIC